jgi:cellulose synthase operon protein C
MSTPAFRLQPSLRQAQATAEPHGAPANAPTIAATPPAAQPSPEPRADFFAGLKSRALTFGQTVVGGKMPNVPIDSNTLSMFRISHRGPPTLPQHRNEVTRNVAVPAPVLADTDNAESLTRRPPPSKSMLKAEHNRRKALSGFSKIDTTAAALIRDTGNAESRDDSDKGTPFAAIKSRIARHVNHTIPRAASKGPELQPAEGEAPVAGMQEGVPAQKPFDRAAAARKRFAGANQEAIVQLVTDVVQAVDTMPAESDDVRVAREVRAARSDLLIHALAETCFGHPETARLVLQRMRQGLRFEPQQMPARQIMDRKLTALAWRTAQRLSPTATGYDCARALAGATWPAPNGGPARYAPKVWLQAANALVMATQCDADPASVARKTAELATGTSATQQAHAAWIASAASRLWDTGNAEGLTESDKGALLAGRQCLFADGPGTPFAAIKSRIARHVNHTIPRATSDDRDLQPAEGEAPVPVSSQRKAYAALVRPFGFQKTAVAGMQEGVQGASLGTWNKDAKELNKAIRDAFAILVQIPGQPAGEDDFTARRSAVLHKDSRAIHQVVEQAEMEVLAELSRPSDAATGADQQPIEYATKLNDGTLDRIAERVAGKLSDEMIRIMARREARQPEQAEATAADNEKPTLREARIHRLLTAFRDKMAAGNTGPRARAAARKLVRAHLINGSNVVDAAKLKCLRKRFGADLPALAQEPFDTIDRIALGKPVTPRGTTTDDYREAGERLIDALEGSGKVILTDGGQFGLSTRGISAVAASFPLIGARLNLQAAHGRHSVLEFSRSTAAYKIGFGTQQRNRFVVGAGLQIGHNVGIVRGGGNMEGAYLWDDSEQSTVDFNVARRLKADDDAYDEKTAKDQLKEINNFLFGNAGGGKSEQALWNELGRLCYDSDDLSVSWTSQVGEVRQTEATANFRVGLKVGTGKTSVRLNGIAGAVHRYVTRAKLDVVAKSGQTKIESHRFGSGHRTGVQVGINATVGDTLQKRGEVEPTDAAIVSVFTPNLCSYEIPVHDTFGQVKPTLVPENGRLQGRASNIDIEFVNFSEYKAVLRQNPVWSVAFGLKPGDPMPDTQEELKATLTAGGAKIQAYLPVLSTNRAQSLMYVLRLRLREHAAHAADALQDRIAAREASNLDGDAGEIQILNGQRDALLARSDSWLPTELLTIQANDRQLSWGVRLGVQLGIQKGGRGEREVTSLKVKPREADKLDNAWPRHLEPLQEE